MGHYDDVRYMSEAREDGYTDDELKELEEYVKEKGRIVVYDDYDGMKKVMMAEDSYILTSSGSGTMYTIKHDPDKVKRLAKDKLNYEPGKPIWSARHRR